MRAEAPASSAASAARHRIFFYKARVLNGFRLTSTYLILQTRLSILHELKFWNGFDGIKVLGKKRPFRGCVRGVGWRRLLKARGAPGASTQARRLSRRVRGRAFLPFTMLWQAPRRLQQSRSSKGLPLSRFNIRRLVRQALPLGKPRIPAMAPLHRTTAFVEPGDFVKVCTILGRHVAAYLVSTQTH